MNTKRDQSSTAAVLVGIVPHPHGGANFPGDHPPPRFDVAVFAVRIEVAAYQFLCSHVDHVLEAARGKECGRLALVDPESERLAGAAHFSELVRRPPQRARTV